MISLAGAVSLTISVKEFLSEDEQSVEDSRSHSEAKSDDSNIEQV